MTAVPRVATTLAAFVRAVGAAEDILVAVEQLRVGAPGGTRILAQRQFEMVAELSFLQLYLAWEEFLEESFIRYFCGSASPNGTKFARLVRPKDRTTAERLLYIHRRPDWTTPGSITMLAESMFDAGGPFAPISGAGIDLQQMKVIRNRIAHRSLSAQRDFEDVVRRVYGAVPRRITPGGYLLGRPPPRHSQAQTFLIHYSGVLVALARMIAP